MCVFAEGGGLAESCLLVERPCTCNTPVFLVPLSLLFVCGEQKVQELDASSRYCGYNIEGKGDVSSLLQIRAALDDGDMDVLSDQLEVCALILRHAHPCKRAGREN